MKNTIQQNKFLIALALVATVTSLSSIASADSYFDGQVTSYSSPTYSYSQAGNSSAYSYSGGSSWNSGWNNNGWGWGSGSGNNGGCNNCHPTQPTPPTPPTPPTQPTYPTGSNSYPWYYNCFTWWNW